MVAIADLKGLRGRVQSVRLRNTVAVRAFPSRLWRNLYRHNAGKVQALVRLAFAGISGQRSPVRRLGRPLVVRTRFIAVARRWRNFVRRGLL